MRTLQRHDEECGRREAGGQPAASVGDAIGERVHAAGLVMPSQSALVALPIRFDVRDVLLPQLFHVLHDDGVAAAGASALSANVRVAPRAVPVAGNRLGIKTSNGVTKARGAVGRKRREIRGSARGGTNRNKRGWT